MKYKYIGTAKHYIPFLKATVTNGALIETDRDIRHPLFEKIMDLNIKFKKNKKWRTKK